MTIRIRIQNPSHPGTYRSAGQVFSREPTTIDEREITAENAAELLADPHLEIELSAPDGYEAEGDAMHRAARAIIAARDRLRESMKGDQKNGLVDELLGRCRAELAAARTGFIMAHGIWMRRQPPAGGAS